MANVSELERSAIFAEEDFVVEAQTFLHNLMIEKGMSRSDLARAMGVSRARVSQIFSDECKNFTVRYLARATHALGEKPSLGCKQAQTQERDDWRLRLLYPEDIEHVWNIQAALTDLRQHIPCNDQSPARLVGYEYSPQEWEAA